MNELDIPHNGHPVDPDRTAINRANAQHSTGPRTESGKKRSALNALRHGLTGHTIVLPSEDLAAYERHSQLFFDQYQPRNPTESQLVQSLVDTSWRINRIPALEANLLSLGMLDHLDSIDVTHPEAQAALAMAAAYAQQTRALTALSAHGQRLSREFHKTLQTLRELQAERRRHEESELKEAADLLEMHQLEDRPYDASKDGFVFSNDQIETFIQRRDRNDRAREASHYLFAAGQ